ncbi:hypothetical protein GPECTOR_11g226 [Gonium pectorale]|uniref:Uncharacterized protein n=1 Tax=Gonium pectorale TaxID=33097 RepID=A0A150GPW6_GONPE|nr:hypothetical protein GPECTOR_11g226 [Gonium pectorale]|eukprot:KXZ51782.1 hypothetical protein GPECTOR_11g226 [Gonium pectorale]
MDWVCTDTTGARGVIRSSISCLPTSLVTGWPSAPLDYCPGLFTVCARPSTWCVHPGSTLRSYDCDNDGTMDWVCTDTAGGRGVIRSSVSCMPPNMITGWPSAPLDYCPGLFTVCSRPATWCTHAGSTLRSYDCDNDGTMDWVCTDTAGGRGVIRSTISCLPTSLVTGWPSAPLDYCPDLFTVTQPAVSAAIAAAAPAAEAPAAVAAAAPAAKAPAAVAAASAAIAASKAAGASTRVRSAIHLDNDGTVDWVCTDTSGRRGIIRSTMSCLPPNMVTGWPNAPIDYCPGLFNGTMDWVCTDTVGGRGVIRSSVSCLPPNMITGWPSAPLDYCPGLFSEWRLC